tara:strand:- start:72 stop:527 length:456 start_codon:yes stop_codon:yes gene_type:complete
MKDTWQQVVVIVSIAAAATVLSVFLHPKAPPWFRVASAEELQWQVNWEEALAIAAETPVLWVDARSREKYEEGHFQDAVLLNVAEWGDLMFQNMDTLQGAMSHPVIVYCDGDDCRKSGEVGQRLRDLLGLDPVYVLKGDWRDLEKGDASKR